MANKKRAKPYTTGKGFKKYLRKEGISGKQLVKLGILTQSDDWRDMSLSDMGEMLFEDKKTKKKGVW